ncbi:hypothetical protein BDZ89DRAFT_750714 [Hymenopellis radicata]|nr:hypothetical protein BDZ89DRAFT_750714 [Hymenopellis radicata]
MIWWRVIVQLSKRVALSHASSWPWPRLLCIPRTWTFIGMRRAIVVNFCLTRVANIACSRLSNSSRFFMALISV